MTRHTYETHENLWYGEPVPDCTSSEIPILFYVHCLRDSYLINEFRPFNFYGKFYVITCQIFHNSRRVIGCPYSFNLITFYTILKLKSLCLSWMLTSINASDFATWHFCHFFTFCYCAHSVYYPGFYNILPSDPFTLRQVLPLHEVWSFHNNEC
jgi:hypothetical protein